ncbi:MAG: hypothetical protein ACRYF3_09795 [Janthinobacterium lividum]
MAIVSLLSAKGSPGVTTSALLIAALWPRPVLLLDADPGGGDIAVRVPAADGGILNAERGLLPLLTSARRGLSADDVLAQAQPVSGGTAVVCGLTSPEQAIAAAQTWPTLAAAVAELGRDPGERDQGEQDPAGLDPIRPDPIGPDPIGLDPIGRGAADRGPIDVVVDAGRLDARPIHLALLRESSVVVLVLRDDVCGVLHARERLRTLGTVLRRADGLRPRVGLLVVGDARRRDAGAAAALVRAAGDWVEDFGMLPLDPAGARVFDGARHPRPERTALVRSGRVLLEAIVAAAHADVRRAA